MLFTQLELNTCAMNTAMRYYRKWLDTRIDDYYDIFHCLSCSI